MTIIHSVKIELKDESNFVYTPRRFTYNEKLKIKEITDDLLSRNIIKVSTLPYCARVVPVRKKNGTLRLYVNLRLFNKKVMKILLFNDKKLPSSIRQLINFHISCSPGWFPPNWDTPRS